MEYSGKMASQEAQLNQLQSQVDSLNETTASAQQQIQTAQDTVASYENLLKGSGSAAAGQYKQCNQCTDGGQPGGPLCRCKRPFTIRSTRACSRRCSRNSQHSGVSAFDDANYTEAIDKLSKAKNINDSDYTVLNYLAHAYRLSGDTDNAISVFQEIIDKFPGTQKATKAEQQIEALGGTVKTEE